MGLRPLIGEMKMDDFVFLALADNGTVKAQFADDLACKNWCSQNKLLYVPFYLKNRFNTPLLQSVKST